MQPLEILEPAFDVPKIGGFQQVHDVGTAQDRFLTLLGVGTDFDADGLAGFENALVKLRDCIFFKQLMIDLGRRIEGIALFIVSLKERFLHLAQFLILLQLLLLVLPDAQHLHLALFFQPADSLHLSLAHILPLEPINNRDEFLHGVSFQIDALFLLDVLLKHLWIVIGLNDLGKEVILLGFELHTISRD